tara:strand:- start:2842 stop:3540 length:699 start_codon:yes stop_codon:yes gene_type:complete
MGGSSSSSGGSNNVARSNPNEMRAREMAAETNRQKAEQEAKSRQTAFNDYQEQRKAASKGIDVMISPEKAKTVRENAGIAMDLDAKAKKSVINVPVPTVGTVAMNTISSINYTNQAKQLRSGGRPVYDMTDGSYQGVVHSGIGGKVYSGNPDYSPIGRTDGISKTKSGSITATRVDSTQGSDNNDSQKQNVTPTKTQTPVEDKTDSTVTLSTASRRALIAGGGGGAARRNLI